MRFSLQREVLLKPLAQVVNVVERRQTLPVLANLLAKVRNGELSLTGTDLEVEMIARTSVEDAQDGEITIPARKFFEIVRALPDGSKVTVSQSGDKVNVQAGRSRFSLASILSPRPRMACDVALACMRFTVRVTAQMVVSHRFSIAELAGILEAVGPRG